MKGDVAYLLDLEFVKGDVAYLLKLEVVKVEVDNLLELEVVKGKVAYLLELEVVEGEVAYQLAGLQTFNPLHSTYDGVTNDLSHFVNSFRNKIFIGVGNGFLFLFLGLCTKTF